MRDTNPAKWRWGLANYEGRIRFLIDFHKSYPAGKDVLAAWDKKRGMRWGDTEADAKYIVSRCVPILEKAYTVEFKKRWPEKAN